MGARRPARRFSYEGEYYQLDDSPALPKPAQAECRCSSAGTARARTPRLAARYADEFNMPFRLDEGARQFGRVRETAEEAGRTRRR